jgi:hypothetical protein
LNDYATEIPMSDFDRFGVLLALKRDGAYMPVRDKGRSSSSTPSTRTPT